MEIYNQDQLKEHQQYNNIKRCFTEHGKALVAAVVAIGVILFICTLGGWILNRHQRQGDARAASLKYENVVSALRNNYAQALATAEKFVVDNQNSYGALAALEIAQHYADKNELDKAAVRLQQGLSSAGDDNLKAIINLRLARIQVQQKKADDALKTLAAVKGEGFAQLVADMRGEAMLRKGDIQGARRTWEAGVKSNTSTALSEVMRIKIDNLSL